MGQTCAILSSRNSYNTFSAKVTFFPFTSRPRNLPFGEQLKASLLATNFSSQTSSSILNERSGISSKSRASISQ
jgi:hypothetical protein